LIFNYDSILSDAFSDDIISYHDAIMLCSNAVTLCNNAVVLCYDIVILYNDAVMHEIESCTFLPHLKRILIERFEKNESGISKLL
jgi:hypothetical protein